MLTSPDWSNLDNLVPVDPTNVENSHKMKPRDRSLDETNFSS